MTHYRKPLSVVSIVAGLALVVAGLVASPAGAAQSDGSITYSCQALLNGTIPLGAPSDSTATVTLTAPDSVAPGGSFEVAVDVDPGIGNGPVAVTPADGAIATMDLAVTGGTPNPAQATSPTLVTGGSNEILEIPTLTDDVTAGASGAVVLTAGQLRVELASGFLVRCTVKSGSASIQVPITSGTTDPDATTTTLDPDATTTTTEVTATTAAPTTAAPTTAAPKPTVAAPATSTTQTKTAQVTYSCQAYISGNATGPPTVDVQTVSITSVDKVNPGQTFPVRVSVKPGVTNGPVPQNAGEIVPSVTLTISGGSPSQLTMTGSPNPSAVAAGGVIPISTMNGSVKATASVGGTVDIAPGGMNLTIKRFDASVTCTPSSTPTVLSVSVVSTPVVVAGSSASASTSGSTSAAGTTLANTGARSTGALSLFGLAMVLSGLAVLRMGRARSQKI